MSSKRRGCVNDPDKFCYICGSFVPSVQWQNMTPFVKNVCYAYFGIKLGDQDKAWANTKCVVFEAVEPWKAKVFSIWYSNGLEGAERTWQRMSLPCPFGSFQTVVKMEKRIFHSHNVYTKQKWYKLLLGINVVRLKYPFFCQRTLFSLLC